MEKVLSNTAIAIIITTSSASTEPVHGEGVPLRFVTATRIAARRHITTRCARMMESKLIWAARVSFKIERTDTDVRSKLQ